MMRLDCTLDYYGTRIEDSRKRYARRTRAAEGVEINQSMYLFAFLAASKRAGIPNSVGTQEIHSFW